ncbi:MAG: ABC transporter substrate-binding protein [Litorilinea sp.]
MQDPQVNRRDFLRLSGLATAGAVMAACNTGSAPAPTTDVPAGDQAAADAQDSTTAAPGLREVARENTLIFMYGGTDGAFTNVGLGNPYNPGSTGHRAVTAAHEPLFYYSAFSDEFIPWLATGYEYNDDYSELIVNIREGVEWSDGEVFDAHDVAFTLETLRTNAPELRNSTEVSNWVESVEAVDDLTVRIVFFEPRPRFYFSHLTAKFDTGIYWLPEHVFRDVEDIAAFEFFDLEQGWPVYTGPFNVVLWSPEQQFLDRRDDWWAAKVGFAELPAMERIIVLPSTGEERAAQLVINNEIDSCLGFRATTIPNAVQGNPNIITHTGRELPMGYIDWWPTSFWFNCDEPPFNTKEMRWAISYAIDRQQMLDVALEGSGILTELPFPYYPPLMPYIEATAPLLERYPTNEHNLTKSSDLMEGLGYTRDNEDFWVLNGERVPAVIYGTAIFNDIGPVLAEQLRRAGFESEYTTPADSGTRRSEGSAKLTLFGHGGSINDPLDTLDMYTSKHYRPTGEPATHVSRWRNPEYDAIVDEMATLPPSPDDNTYMDLYLAAMEIWLDNLVDAPLQQWLHRIPMNSTYWQNWPTEDNNYVNGAFWHQTVGLLIMGLEPAS